MSKVFSALRRALYEGQDGVASSDKMTELLLQDPTRISPRKRERLGAGYRSKLSDKDVSGEESLQHAIDKTLVAVHGVHTPMAEQYRKLFVEIVRASHTRPIRTVLITSAMSKEGKTTTALNLAITLAASQDERDVLFVEADLRRPRVQTLLGTQPKYGLSDFLADDMDCAQVCTTTTIPRLTIVHAGRHVHDPTALLTSAKMADFFTEVKAQQQYRYIIVDTGPVLLTSETNALVHYADATILVVHAGKTPRDLIVKTVETIGKDHIMGCVFNGLQVTDSYYYNYYYDSEYYGETH
jgi:capsular exopolysaccharide synthesis family protein